MRISTFASPQAVVDENSTIKNRFVIVIDALRATTVIVEALSNGARSVIPVMDIEEAVKLYHTLGADMALLCGEREGNPISGFHLGNSPFEYTAKAVRGMTLIMTTTNGTRAIHAAAGASVLAIGALVNATAVAGDARMSGQDVTLLCAGTRGRFSMEDILAAGAILDAINPPVSGMDDLSIMAREAYLKYMHNLPGALEHCAHARYLVDAGYGRDVDYCMMKDCLKAVPYYEKGMVRLL